MNTITTTNLLINNVELSPVRRNNYYLDSSQIGNNKLMELESSSPTAFDFIIDKKKVGTTFRQFVTQSK